MWTWIKSVLIICFSLTFMSANKGHASTINKTMDIQALLHEYMDDYGGVGVTIGFIDNGEVRFFFCGNKSLRDNSPVSEDTFFEIGSITKVFTTLALAEMVSKGEVQLDDPIELYLSNVQIPDMDGKKITLRHLATHTSGLPSLPDNFSPKDMNNPYADYAIENLYEYLNHCKLQNSPGSRFEYSNIGMGLLGHILSLKAGQSYEMVILSLCEKLGMTHTFISLNPDLEKRMAKGYQSEQAVGYWDFASLAGAGAIRSDIRDMTLFLQAAMGLSQSPMADLLNQCHQQNVSASQTLGIGLGWMISHQKDSKIIWHNGGTGGFRSYLGFNPELQRGVIVLSNSTEGWDEFCVSLLDPDYKKPSIDRVLANDYDYLNRFAGTYKATLSSNHSDQEMQIAIFGKQLGCMISGWGIAMLYPEKKGIFGIRGCSDGKLYFTLDDQEKIIAVKAVLSSTNLWEAIPFEMGK